MCAGGVREEWQEAPSDDEVRASITISWSRVLTANTDYQLHRVLVALGEDQADWEDAERLLSAFCEKVRELVGRRPPCIWCLTRFFSSAQLRQHQVLYRDIYDIEMRLREVLTYIFLDAMPDRPYTFLDRNAVKLQGGDACHTEEYLKAHNENQLFHILFSDYEGLNRNVIARPTDLIALIRDNQTYDALREAAAETPVKSERHTSFISGLRELVPCYRGSPQCNCTQPRSDEEDSGELRCRQTAPTPSDRTNLDRRGRHGGGKR